MTDKIIAFAPEILHPGWLYIICCVLLHWIMACITLLSDFGLQDASVAIAKGILMQHAPGLPIFDISHDIKPFHSGQAAYLLSSAYKNFPAGTCHILLFDLFSETNPRLVLCEHMDSYFLAPDNGLLPLALGNETSNALQCFELH